MINYSVLLWGILLWNGFVVLLFLADKLFAIMHVFRVSEWILMLSALCLGGVGGGVGMVLFNHKTEKWKFRILMPLFAIITSLCTGYVSFLAATQT